MIDAGPEKSPYLEESNMAESRQQPHQGGVASSVISTPSMDRLTKQNKFLCWKPQDVTLSAMKRRAEEECGRQIGPTVISSIIQEQNISQTPDFI